jgi:hypothetical protein
LKIFELTLFITLLGGCVATDQRFIPPESTISGDPQIVVYRISQIGGKAGTWVKTRLEVNGIVVGKLPDGSFITFSQPAGDITLSATAMWNFHYADEDRVTLRDRAGKGEVAYFRIESVFGTDCALVSEKVDGTETAYGTHYPRPDLAQTLCFQRVPEAVAFRALADLKRAD